MAEKKSNLPWIIGGVGLVGALAILMGAKAQDDEPLPKPPLPEPPPDVPPSKPKPGKKGKHSGNPPRGDTYDPQYWGNTTDERLTQIRQHFKDLGYNVEVGPWPMNELGPKGTIEMENKPGSEIPIGKLGGGDDKPNLFVGEFQLNYNDVSFFNDKFNVIGFDMGGLKEDKFLGFFTLNALRAAHDDLGNLEWQKVVGDAEESELG